MGLDCIYIYIYIYTVPNNNMAVEIKRYKSPIKFSIVYHINRLDCVYILYKVIMCTFSALATIVLQWGIIKINV